MKRYIVTIEPDGSVDITWAAPVPEDRANRDAAILDRESVSARTLSGMLTDLQEGRR